MICTLTQAGQGAAYTEERVAAPFAILDAVYESLHVLLTADPNIRLTPSELRWSVNNIAAAGNRRNGEIGTSFYDPKQNNMYILGHANNDTDEYDKSVIQHEMAHYIEDTLSRSDSPGGPHTLSGAFDMRLAFGEGFANAFAGFVGGEGIYADSAGSKQNQGFNFSLENNHIGNAGWFNENSIGKIIYDIVDDNDDGEDTISLGFKPIYDTMVSNDYINSPAFISIYLFSDILKRMSEPSIATVIDSLLKDEDIMGSGIYGEGETNASASNISFVLPVYRELAQGDTINACGNNREDEYNGLDVRRFIRINIESSGSYQFSLNKTLGTGAKDPDIFILKQGRRVALLDSSAVDQERGTLSLSEGEHILEVFDYFNTDQARGGGSSCFDVTYN